MNTNPGPYMFVVGCPRSGTTLLQRMLDHHPMLAVANDTHFIPRCLERFEPFSVAAARDGAPVALTDSLIRGVLGYHRFRRLELSESDVVADASVSKTYNEFVGSLYGRFARNHGKAFGGEKTPDYVRRLPLLHGLFPDARTVHIIRDGRDVALSVREWADEKKGPGKLELWRDEPAAVCAMWWRWQVESGRTSGRTLGRERYTEVVYERLVASAEDELRRISDFLDLPFSDDMLRFHEGKRRDAPGLSAKKAWLPPTTGLRDWRTQMAPRDIEMFETLAGDLLRELGYELAGGRPSPRVVDTAERCSRWFRGWIERREAKIRRRAARVGAERGSA